MSLQGPTITANESGTKNETRTPYGPAIPYINDIYSEGQRLYNSGSGSNLWGGPLQSPLNPYMLSGISRMANLAGGLTPESQGIFGDGSGLSRTMGGAGGAGGMSPDGSIGNTSSPWQAALAGMSNGGISPQMQQLLTQLGNPGQIGTGAQFGDIYNRAGSQNAGSIAGMTGVADSARGATFAERYLGDMAGAKDVNPYLKDLLAANDARISNRVNTTMTGMGRPMSVGHSDSLARTLAESDNPILASAFESGQNRALSAAQAMDASRRGADATALAGYGAAAGTRQGDTSQMLGATQGQTGVENANITNRITGAHAAVEGMNAAGRNALGWGALAPGLNELQYDPAKKMLSLGSMLQGRQDQLLSAERGLFEEGKNADWSRLGKYLQSLSGTSPLVGNAGNTNGSFTGHKVQESEQPFNWTQGLGLGMAGLGMLFNPMGSMGGMMGGGGMFGGGGGGSLFNFMNMNPSGFGGW